MAGRPLTRRDPDSRPHRRIRCGRSADWFPVRRPFVRVPGRRCGQICGSGGGPPRDPATDGVPCAESAAIRRPIPDKIRDIPKPFFLASRELRPLRPADCPGGRRPTPTARQFAGSDVRYCDVRGGADDSPLAEASRRFRLARSCAASVSFTLRPAWARDRLTP
jgi:hypothetical protein